MTTNEPVGAAITPPVLLRTSAWAGIDRAGGGHPSDVIIRGPPECCAHPSFVIILVNGRVSEDV